VSVRPFPPLFLEAVVAVLVVLLIWYVLGSQVQRATATRLARQAAAMMRPIGTEGTFKWLGRSGGEMRLSQLRRPFRGILVVVWLQPRAFFPAWLYGRLQNRRDLFAVAADLASPPTVALDLVDPSFPAGQRDLLQALARGWERENLRYAGQPMVLIAPDLKAGRRIAVALEKVRSPGDAGLVRLAVSPTAPHLSATFAQPERLDNPPGRFAAWLTRAAELVSGRP